MHSLTRAIRQRRFPWFTNVDLFDRVNQAGSIGGARMRLIQSRDASPKLLWSPLLTAAIEFENGAILRALIGVRDHQDGTATWRVSRHHGDACTMISEGIAESLDLAANAASSFVLSWDSDGVTLAAAPSPET